VCLRTLNTNYEYNYMIMNTDLIVTDIKVIYIYHVIKNKSIHNMEITMVYYYRTNGQRNVP
jgi:hypothetical protein